MFETFESLFDLLFWIFPSISESSPKEILLGLIFEMVFDF